MKKILISIMLLFSFLTYSKSIRATLLDNIDGVVYKKEFFSTEDEKFFTEKDEIISYISSVSDENLKLIVVFSNFKEPLFYNKVKLYSDKKEKEFAVNSEIVKKADEYADESTIYFEKNEKDELLDLLELLENTDVYIEFSSDKKEVKFKVDSEVKERFIITIKQFIAK